jgi:hypothetical protein
MTTVSVEFSGDEIFAVWKALLVAREQLAARARAMDSDPDPDSGDEEITPEERVSLAADLDAVEVALAKVARAADGYEGPKLVT